jgi:hypothetical protein
VARGSDSSSGGGGSSGSNGVRYDAACQCGAGIPWQHKTMEIASPLFTEDYFIHDNAGWRLATRKKLFAHKGKPSSSEPEKSSSDIDQP